ncbi:hypothetical protein BJ508DRAFT_307901 [Ascobolus immersus RN42]|uniref:Uncharacterized protein n=1 Tax=Ascobolus immersus RN42 TaxID=1160509 RepID=A0A3N4I752_ASCIM|nr:hypothetical protein BJ508DRAFT_307901 [Ascobolus immersus RN42]
MPPKNRQRSLSEPESSRPSSQDPAPSSRRKKIWLPKVEITTDNRTFFGTVALGNPAGYSNFNAAKHIAKKEISENIDFYTITSAPRTRFAVPCPRGHFELSFTVPDTPEQIQQRTPWGRISHRRVLIGYRYGDIQDGTIDNDAYETEDDLINVTDVIENPSDDEGADSDAGVMVEDVAGGLGTKSGGGALQVGPDVGLIQPKVICLNDLLGGMRVLKREKVHRITYENVLGSGILEESDDNPHVVAIGDIVASLDGVEKLIEKFEIMLESAEEGPVGEKSAAALALEKGIDVSFEPPAEKKKMETVVEESSEEE